MMSKEEFYGVSGVLLLSVVLTGHPVWALVTAGVFGAWVWKGIG